MKRLQRSPVGLLIPLDGSVTFCEKFVVRRREFLTSLLIQPAAPNIWVKIRTNYFQGSTVTTLTLHTKTPLLSLHSLTSAHNSYKCPQQFNKCPQHNPARFDSLKISILSFIHMPKTVKQSGMSATWTRSRFLFYFLQV